MPTKRYNTLLSRDEVQTVLTRFFKDDRGQNLIEYLLIGSFIAVVALVGAATLGAQLNAWFDAMASWVDIAPTAAPSSSPIDP